jgi:hypothetical protein
LAVRQSSVGRSLDLEGANVERFGPFSRCRRLHDGNSSSLSAWRTPRGRDAPT